MRYTASPTTYRASLLKYDQLREKGLANFEYLLDYWGIEYKKLTEVEYDFINPTREDRDFGACRFNTQKGRGADFASRTISKEDCRNFGLGFTPEDFSGYTNGAPYKAGFDIIGLTQRIHNCNTYSDAAGWLRSDLSKLGENSALVIPSKDAAEKRRKEQAAQLQKKIELSQRLWHTAKELKGSKGELYFKNRHGLNPQETNIRINPWLKHISGVRYPTLLFKVQREPNGPIVAIHRIFLSENGEIKAPVNDPKMALGAIKGAGIWFGKPCDTLFVAEGPENALVYREVGKTFVVSTVYSTNYHNLTIPDCVKTVILVPDEDKAGLSACKLAIETYTKQGKRVKMVRLNG